MSQQTRWIPAAWLAVPLLQPRADTVKAPGRRVGVGDGNRSPGTQKVGCQDAPRPRRQTVAILHVINLTDHGREPDRRPMGIQRQEPLDRLAHNQNASCANETGIQESQETKGKAFPDRHIRTLRD